MNAFNYNEKFYDAQTKKMVPVYEAPKQELRVPLVMLAALSTEGPKEGPKNRTAQVAQVLIAHNLNLDKFNNLKIKH